jgi:hypothetical protein
VLDVHITYIQTPSILHDSLKCDNLIIVSVYHVCNKAEVTHNNNPWYVQYVRDTITRSHDKSKLIWSDVIHALAIMF